MSGEKTLDPTKKKLEDSRKEGQVATSMDFMRSAVSIMVFEGVLILAREYGTFLITYFRDFVFQLGNLNNTAEWNYSHFFYWIFIACAVSAAFVAAAVIVWTALSWAQTGGPVILETPLAFKLDKLDPANYFKNVFSMKTITTFGGNIFKSTIITVLFFYAVITSFGTVYAVVSHGLPAVLAIIGDRLTHFIRVTLWILLSMSLFDVWMQRRMLRRSLRMSHQDMKEEHKGMEGNPEVKQQVREIGHELLSGESGKADPLKGANALVVNPTHIAVGIHFSPETKRLPSVRVRAEESGATRLIELAHDGKVPVIRHLWLARTLYEVAPGKNIPQETYKTVAAIYRVIQGLNPPSTAPSEPPNAATVPSGIETTPT